MAPQIFIGIDLSPARPPFTFAALDSDRKLAALSQGPLAAVLAYTAGQREAVVAISAPTPTAGARQAEAQLRQMGVFLPRLAPVPADCPAWVQRGFALYAGLAANDYAPYPASAPRLWLETHAEACYQSLLGLPPFPAGTLEGRLQRQLVLRSQDLPVRDAMDFFEEVTRHKLLKGILPTQDLHTQPELNALMAARVAVLAVLHPERLAALGDPAEGQIYLPNPL